MKKNQTNNIKSSVNRYLVLLLVMALPCITLGLQKSVALGGGVATFSDHYNTGINVMGKVQLQSYNGVSLDLNSGYIRADAKEKTNPRLHMAPILLGATYTHKRAFSTIEPYAGLLLGVSLMSDSFNSPLLTYGGRLGIDLKMDGGLSLFLEAQYLTLKDSETKTNLKINPLSAAMGIKLNLGSDRKGPRIGKRPSKRNQKRRRKQRYQRR